MSRPLVGIQVVDLLVRADVVGLGEAPDKGDGGLVLDGTDLAGERALFPPLGRTAAPMSSRGLCRLYQQQVLPPGQAVANHKGRGPC